MKSLINSTLPLPCGIARRLESKHSNAAHLVPFPQEVSLPTERDFRESVERWGAPSGGPREQRPDPNRLATSPLAVFSSEFVGRAQRVLRILHGRWDPYLC